MPSTITHSLQLWIDKLGSTDSLYNWPGLLLLLAFAFTGDKLIGFSIRFLLNRNFPILKNAPRGLLQKAVYPIGKIFFLTFIDINLKLLKLPAAEAKIADRILSILLAISLTWFLHQLVKVVSYYFTNIAKRTKTKFDDILIPLITKTAFGLVYIIGALLVARSLTIDVTGIIAGLGIGGLAFAFAAKDTIANFFGSVMLVIDRPFDIGDIIVAGDIEGIIESVGFRSTRVRTFSDSIITIPNGQLMNMPIDNKGKRRYRRLNTTIGVEYDTPANKIEAFCEGIRQLILGYKWTRKDSFHVYFSDMAASSLDIKLVVFWETDDYAREMAERHRLMVDVLRLAKELEINFAFPTQTVHLFNEEKVAFKNVDEKKYLDEGIEKAKAVVTKPLSLMNPRSNASDENQFGKNDIGL